MNEHLEDECKHLEDEPVVPRMNSNMWEMIQNLEDEYKHLEDE